MTNILIRIAALRDVVELVLREVDEGREVPIINNVRPGVVGVQVESLPEPLDHLQRHAVVNGVDDAVVVVEKSAVWKLQSVRKNRLAGQQQRSPFAGAQATVGIYPALRDGRIPRLTSTLRTGNVQAVSENQPVRADEEIPGADRQTFTKRAVDLQAGLMGVRKLMVIASKSPGPGGASGRTIAGQKYSRISPRGENAAGRARRRAEAEPGKGFDTSCTRHRRWQESRRIDQIQLPAPGLGASTNHRKSYPWQKTWNCL